MPQPMFQTNLTSLPLVARGKVRDNYAVGADRLLMVATDRLSAFDVVMEDPIPDKGEMLTQMALFWFRQLSHVVPNHLTGENPETVVAESEQDQVRGRSMLVKRLNPLPVEAVVRGYLAGSAWSEYQRTGAVCDERLPTGLNIASKLSSPIFTPATKAEAGAHDENISFIKMASQIGEELAKRVRDLAIDLYQEGAAIALSKGIIIADTKFEFGLDKNGTLTLMDEVMTPDSSRFWPVEHYKEGINPASFDKQFVRDWLDQVVVNGARWNKQAPAPRLPADIIRKTTARYREAYQRLLA
jgi:phosphoribosylaminoimidazole-succinocarboxamide synthase